MKLIKKKIAHKWYGLQLVGAKPWELRVNDCDYQQGDFLILQEWEDEQFTGREMQTVIVYVAKELPYVPQDVVIITTREANTIEKEKIKQMIEEEIK